MSKIKIRKHIERITPYKGVEPLDHIAQRINLDASQMIKLDANENPYGASLMVQEFLANSNLSTYPDPNQIEVRSILAAYTGLPADNIVAGAGADELIDLIARLIIEPGDNIVNLTPTFGMYSVVTEINAGKTINIPRNENFEVSVSAIKKAVTDKTKIIFLCNPNNPSGTLTSESVIKSILELGPLVVIDETYHEFSGSTAAQLVLEYENVIVLRSLSKWAGLAGLRIGYCMAPKYLTEYLFTIKSPYNISIASEQALIATMDDTDYLLGNVRALVRERERMKQAIEKIKGITCYPSKGNFLLCRFPKNTSNDLNNHLIKNGIIVRKFDDSGLKDCLRISAGKPFQTDAVIKAIEEFILSKGSK
jgi:histidinol-phosphate aminotransferase